MNDAPENLDQPEEPLLPPIADEAEPPDLSQEQIAAPPPVTVPPTTAGRAPRRQPTSCLLRFVVILTLILGLASLAVSGFLLYSLNTVRQAATSSLDAALDALADLESRGFQYEYQFSDRLPVEVEIPVQQEMTVPIQEDLAIKTNVRVPIDAGVLGTFVLDVPIDTSIPLDLEVPVQISQTVAISTSIPLSLTVPIDIKADDPAIQQLFDNLRRWLLELRESLDVNVFWRLPGGW